MKRLFPAVCFLIVLLASLAPVSAQYERLFTVNDGGDTNDASAGDGICAAANGKCTLRAAIEEANFDNYQDAIIFALPIPATINLTLGELTIASNVYIAGPGARNLTIQRSVAPGTPDFRIFHVVPAVGSLVMIRGLKVANGRASAVDGGGIYIEESNIVHLRDLAVTGNFANRGGGVANSGLLIINRSLISSNVAVSSQNISGAGGGLFNRDPYGVVEIANSTVTGNSAVTGGAIYNASDLFLINNTISHNMADNPGCSIFNTPSEAAEVFNTIIGMDSQCSASSLSGTFNSVGNNLITDARNSTGFTHGVNNDQVSNSNAIDPLLGDLADNGGQTDTRALLKGSPAIDRGNGCISMGNCPPPFPSSYRLFTDQRIDRLRSRGDSADVGAFEYQSPLIGGIGLLGTIVNRTRAGGSLLILTSAATNEKQTRISNPFGNVQFTNISPTDVYMLERFPKRLGETRGLGIFAFEGFSLSSLAPENASFSVDVATPLLGRSTSSPP